MPLYSPLYAATEGLIGVNTSLGAKTYVLHPRAMFFEAIHELEMDPPDGGPPTTVFMEEMEVGQAYELVITNLTGLCVVCM